MDTDSAAIAPLLNGVARLSGWGVVRVSGEDAASFLHHQLTQDFLLLDASEARLAALCSAKGRMLASFIGIKRSPQELLLLCSQDILAATVKRLSMFVLRAKVKLNDATAEFSLFGLAGDAISSIATGAENTWARVDFDTEIAVFLYPAMGQARVLYLAPAGSVPASLAAFAPMDEALWLWSEVRSGVATLTQPVVDAFVPQMLNYESVGGVSFQKGCYPGQEVVARSQFRGSLKRRASLLHSEQILQPGQEIFADLTQGAAPSDAQPCGVVVQVAAAPGGGYDAIVCLQTAVLTAAPSATLPELSVPAAQVEVLRHLALPYALRDDL
ncbi:MAG: YgfZ/GcvT domain-containing protein [Burkholderiaceae bacterium]